jgi:hypothetical protein
MRRTLFVVAFILSVPALAAAQELGDYQNNADGFKVILPGQPTMTSTTWVSEHGYTLPAHVYKVDKGPEHYSILVVDYRPIEQMGINRATKECPPRENLCTGNANTGPGLWKHDVRGVLVYASRKLMQRDGVKLTDFVWAQHDRVEGQELQLSNPDGSRTFAFVAAHDMRLYVSEATVPKNYPPATLFQTSMSFVDKDGKPLAYQIIYSNMYHGMGVYPAPPQGAVPGQ